MWFVASGKHHEFEDVPQETFPSNRPLPRVDISTVTSATSSDSSDVIAEFQASMSSRSWTGLSCQITCLRSHIDWLATDGASVIMFPLLGRMALARPGDRRPPRRTALSIRHLHVISGDNLPVDRDDSAAIRPHSDLPSSTSIRVTKPVISTLSPGLAFCGVSMAKG